MDHHLWAHLFLCMKSPSQMLTVSSSGPCRTPPSLPQCSPDFLEKCSLNFTLPSNLSQVRHCCLSLLFSH
ncbi:hypothetical protein L208DRAFT_766849 [Tricholoma matsutake]|nr:hypothetical protein L208DRAFT_766849 [Tricholoma matsutake 945]